MALRNCEGAPRRTLEMRGLSGLLEMVDEPPGR
jgi:hypothetical protein